MSRVHVASDMQPCSPAYVAWTLSQLWCGRGAHNGYWAALVKKEAGRLSAGAPEIQALDISPPERSWSSAMPVTFGSAASLKARSVDTLFICMPSPGESSLADEALDHFDGTCVVYVGEWGRCEPKECCDVGRESYL